MSPLAPLVYLAFVVLFELVLVVPDTDGDGLNGSHYRGAWREDEL